MASAIHPSRALHPNPTKVRPSHSIAYLLVIGLSSFLAHAADHREGAATRRGAAEIGPFRPQLSQYSASSARALLDRIPAPRQARRVGLLVVAVGGLLLGLRLLGGLRRRAVVRVLFHRARGGAGAGALRRPLHRATLLRRRRGRLGRLGGVEARLLLGPVMTFVLVLLERVLALS